ncbi:MAG: nucleotidyltransferase family protein, partial [Tepidiformaceae bacterium]
IRGRAPSWACRLWQNIGMRRDYPIAIPYEAIAEFCRRNRIRKLSLFGSILRDDFTPESDVDVLVEFEEGYRPGLKFFGMGDELADILGRRVDFLSPGWIHERLLPRILEEATPVYDAAA